MIFRQGVFYGRSRGNIVPYANSKGRAEKREYVQRPTGGTANSQHGGGLFAVRRYRHARGRLVFILEPCIGIVVGRILARQIGVHGMDDQFVVRHALFFQRLIAGDDQLVRIDELPLPPDTEIEMGAGRRAGRVCRYSCFWQNGTYAR